METILSIILKIFSSILNAIIVMAKAIIEQFVIIKSSTFTTTAFLETWGRIRAFTNIIFILFILAIAILNLLSDWVDNYTMKKLLPRLLLAIVLVNLSLFICRVVIDFADILSSAFLNLNNIQLNNISAFKETQNTLQQAGAAVTDLVSGIISIIMALIGILAVLLTVLMLLIRFAVIWFLVIISPLSFLLWVLPQTQGLFNKWWQEFVKYSLMGPVICLILSIGEIFIKNISPSLGSVQYLGLIFSASVLLIAAALPMSMGGAIMAKAVDLGKKAWNSGISQSARGRIKEAYWGQMSDQRGLIGNTLGKLQTERGRAKREALATKAKEPIYANLSLDHLQKLAEKKDQAAISELIRRGEYNRIPENTKLNASNQTKLISHDPIRAGLSNEEIAKRLNSGMIVPEELTSSAINELLARNILNSNHVTAIATRGDEFRKNALVSYYASNAEAFNRLDQTAQTAIINSAMTSSDTNVGASLISNLNERQLVNALNNTPLSLLTEWQKFGILHQLHTEGKTEVFKDWVSNNPQAAKELLAKGKINQEIAEILNFPKQEEISNQPNNQNRTNNREEAPPPI